MNRYLKSLLVVSLTWAMPGNAEFSLAKVKQAVSDWYKSYDIKSCPKDLALSYLALAGITLVHEMGHAVAAKVFLKAKPQIHFGVFPGSERKKPLVKLPGITVHTCNPCAAYCYSPGANPDLAEQRWRKIILSLTGPLAGTAAGLLIAKAAKKMDSTKYPLLSLIGWGCVAGHLLGTLLPYKGSDGWHIWQDLQGRPW